MKLVSKYQAFLDSLLSKNLFFCQFTPLKCQSWRFPTFLESLFLRALFRKKTCFESKFSRKIRLWTNFFTTPQTFEEKEYFVSKFELNIHIASKLESKVSQRIRFRSEIVFFKKQILMKVLLKENHFWIVLRQKTPSYATLRFLKNQQLLNKLKKKTVFLSRLLRRIRFWNMFLTKSQIRIKIFKISQFLVNFTKLVIFCIGNFTECEILKHIFYHTSALNGNFDNATQFHMKLVSKYQAFLDNLLSKSLFLSIYTLKMSKLKFSHFLRKFVSGSDVSEKKHALNRKLREKSDCEPVFFYNASDIWWKKNTSCQSLNWITT